MTQAIAFMNAHVFDGEHSHQQTTVVVEDGRIKGVGQGELPSHARAVDLKGRTLMPGMSLGHWHGEYVDIGPPRFSSGRGGLFIGTEEPPVVLALFAATAMQTALMSGITRIVSGACSNDIDWQLRLAVDRGIFPGPRLTPCSRHIVTTGDYEDRGHWWKNEQLQMMDGIRRIGGNVFVDGPEQMMKAVRQEILRGAEVIKVLPTGGHGFELLKRYRGLSREELIAVVNTAHEHGARVRAHTNSAASILECVNVGVDIIDHADEVNDECIEAMAKAGSHWIPSLLFTKVVSYAGVGDARPDVQLDSAWDNVTQMLGKAEAAGINIVPGDDYGGTGMEHALGVYARELLVYGDDCGIDYATVLKWTTKNGAKLALSDREDGTIEVGKRADLIVIDGDPTKDLSLLLDPVRNLSAVMLAGCFVKDELDRVGVNIAPRPDRTLRANLPIQPNELVNA